MFGTGECTEPAQTFSFIRPISNNLTCSTNTRTRSLEIRVSLMNNINLLITLVSRRYAVVFLRSLPSQTMRENLRAYLLRHFLAAQCIYQ